MRTQKSQNAFVLGDWVLKFQEKTRHNELSRFGWFQCLTPPKNVVFEDFRKRPKNISFASGDFCIRMTIRPAKRVAFSEAHPFVGAWPLSGPCLPCDLHPPVGVVFMSGVPTGLVGPARMSQKRGKPRRKHVGGGLQLVHPRPMANWELVASAPSRLGPKIRLKIVFS